MLRFRETLDELSDPLRVPLVLVAVPTAGEALRVTVVPVGMFTPLTTTATGLIVLYGSMTSGVLKAPLGIDGTLCPPMEAIVKVGMLGGVTA